MNTQENTMNSKDKGAIKMKININSKKNNISGFYYTVDVEENENGREMNNSEYVERM